MKQKNKNQKKHNAKKQYLKLCYLLHVICGVGFFFGIYVIRHCCLTYKHELTYILRFAFLQYPVNVIC